MITISIRRVLAVLAIVAGLLAAVAGTPDGGRGTADVERMAAVVAREDDHVTAIELASWIRNRREGLRIIDLRSPAEFEGYHLPGAERIALESLARTSFTPDETVVLISGGGAHAAQAWVFLEAMGHRRTFFLRGGLQEWLDDVMSPTIRADADPSTKAAFAKIAELSRYFGGVPRVAGPGEPVTIVGDVPRVHADLLGVDASRASAAAIRRRGC